MTSMVGQTATAFWSDDGRRLLRDVERTCGRAVRNARASEVESVLEAIELVVESVDELLPSTLREHPTRQSPRMLKLRLN